MIKITQTVLLAITLLIAGQASAAGFAVFENIEKCENARAAGKAIAYKPTTVAPFKGGKGWEKKVVPAGGACLGGAHVLEDGAPKNGMSVFVEEGFVYWEQTTTGAFRMNDCSNPFGQISFAKSKATTPATQPTATAAASCTTDDCGNTVKVVEQRTIINEVVEIRQQCTANGKEIALVNGQCVAPQIFVALPVKAESTTEGSCGAKCTPTPKFNLTNKAARTDGRCVVHVTSKGSDYYIRLSPEKDTGRLMAAIVKNEIGDFDRTAPIAYVGDDEKTFHANATCEAAFQGFTSTRSYAPTIRRLKLDNCVVRGLV